MSNRLCTEQAIAFRNALEEWLFAVEKTQQLTNFANFSWDGRPREPDWVEKMTRVRGVLDKKHEAFIRELDGYLDCVQK
jgi:hypothetical protein